MSITLDALARDYFAKQSEYSRLCAIVPADTDQRVAHELAMRDALDALIEASMRLDAARKFPALTEQKQAAE